MAGLVLRVSQTDAAPRRSSWTFGRPVHAPVALLAGALLIATGAPGALVLVAGVALGLPHGALDYLPARRLLAPRFGQAWIAVFGVAYLLVAGAVLASWSVAPAVTLALFLVASAYHFGEADAPEERTALQVARGLLPILAPTLLHPAAVQRIFSWLAGVEGSQGLIALLRGPVLALWFVLAVVAGAQLLRQGRWRASLVEAMLLLAMFATLPPLIAFACYFALVHTPRALEEFGAPLPLLRQALPLTFAGTLIGALIWLRTPDLDFSERTVKTVFELLSALTAPHMLLHWLTRKVSG